MKTKLSFFLCLALLLAACSDDPDQDARTHVFRSLTLTPNPCEVGDTVVGVVDFEDPGHHIAFATYTATISYVEDNTTITKTVYSAPRLVLKAGERPTFKFAIDRPGSYTVRFTSSMVNFSTLGPNGTLYGAGSSVQAPLVVFDHNAN